MDFITFLSSTSLQFVAVASVVVLALVEFLKTIGMNTRYAPLFAVAFGLTIGVCYAGYEQVQYNILAGLLAGLTATGAYGGVKKVVKG